MFPALRRYCLCTIHYLLWNIKFHVVYICVNQCVYFFGNFLTEIIICTSSYNYVILDLIFYIFFPSIILFKHTKCVYFCTYIIFIKFFWLCYKHIFPSDSSDSRLSNGTLRNWPPDISLNILHCAHQTLSIRLSIPIIPAYAHMYASTYMQMGW